VYESESELLQAISSGHCEIGIASNSAAAAYDLATHSPAATIADVDGVGIGRHARNPEGALKLVEWLFAELPMSTFDSVDAAGQKNVSLVAWHFEEAVKLAERAHYR
jgi:iron(III) transport system substrate-binding protein